MTRKYIGERIGLEFGGWRFAISCLDESLFYSLKEGYIWIPPPPNPDFAFKVGHTFHSRSVYRSWQEFSYGGISGYYNLSQGEIKILFQDGFTPISHTYFLPFLMGVFYLLERRKGNSSVLLHAAGIVLDGRGYVFTGNSGSGKTTICNLSPQNSVILSDELVLLSKHEKGYSISSLPIKGVHHRAGRSKNVKAILVLVQDNRTFLTRLMCTKGIFRLAEFIVTPYTTSFLPYPERVSERLRLVCDVAENIPIYELRFENNNNFWKKIEELRDEY